MTATEPRILKLLVETDEGGRAAYEEVTAEHLVERRYRLLLSPGFILGVARGDVIELDGADPTRFSVVGRSGLLAIQVFWDGDIDAVDTFLAPRLEALDGTRDGRSDSVLVYSVPVSAGFDKIGEVMAQATSRFENLEWFYGNVYDPADGVTPLRWWEHEPE